MTLSLSGARVQDPILSTVAQEYADPEFVGMALFPRINVRVAGGQIIEFDKEAFYSYNLRRAPGGATKRLSFGYLGRPYALLQDAVEMPVPDEHQRDASLVPGIDLGTRAVNMAMRVVARSLEIEQAAVALDAARYDGDHKDDLAGAEKWSDEDCKPRTSINTAREAIRATTGAYPTVMLLGPAAFNALRDNPAVIERFKYTSRDSITADMLANFLDIERVVVGRGIKASDAGAFSDIWGNNALLAYVPRTPQGAEEPSYGYSYTMMGHPLVVKPYRDENAVSWFYPVRYERAPVMSSMAAGYLIQNPA